MQEKTIQKGDVVDYYELYYKKGEIRPAREYEEKMEFFGPLVPGKKFLDVACGTGAFLKVADNKDLSCFGIEISPKAIEMAKHAVPMADIRMAEAESLPFADKYFDYVSCLGSLEHFLDMSRGLNEMIRVGKDDAQFLIMVPNKNYLFWKVTGEEGTGQIKETLWSYRQWKQFFLSHGLVIDHVYQDRWPARSVPIAGSPIRILRRLVYRLIWVCMPLQYTYQFIFVMKKKASQ